ncbi:hypothetical protein LEN26_006375 [Aphanomyces euteiches]|nr:hypothetical protein AeMF1_003220 [Aphanomyces euteiches]KAH9135683.1 hypothetical protein LEN26_006375 [Aphanomyces euteiches]KAH9193614.1 hypothetical protein AeNC1_004416 [Aphanomyces euteiches]
MEKTAASMLETLVKWREENEASLSMRRQANLKEMSMKKAMLLDGIKEMRALCKTPFLPPPVPIYHANEPGEESEPIRKRKRGVGRPKRNAVAEKNTKKPIVETKHQPTTHMKRIAPTRRRRRGGMDAKILQDIETYDWNSPFSIESATKRLAQLKEADPAIADCLDIVHFRYGPHMWTDATVGPRSRKRSSPTEYQV